MDREFRIATEEDRQAYLDAMSYAAKLWDSRAICYAIMSSHVHHGMLAGMQAPGRFFHSVHQRYAQHFHGKHGSLGPVFASRPKIYEVQSQSLAKLVAYLHLNPVRAGVVSLPSESTWTSHRAYLRLEPAPSWLDVEWALDLLGFSDTENSRNHFDDFVRNVDLADFSMKSTIIPDSLFPNQSPPKPRLPLKSLIETVAQKLRLTEKRLIQSRTKPAVAARRAVAKIAYENYFYGCSEIGAALNCSPSSVNKLIHRPSNNPSERLLEELRSKLK